MPLIVYYIILWLAVFMYACNNKDEPTPTDEYEINLYISLGPFSKLPDTASDSQDDLFYYWGRRVRFSVTGLDPGINDGISLQGSDIFDWTGSSYEDGTQYAAYTFTLINPSGYPGGRFRFQMYVDWNGNGTLDAGDVYMLNYSIFADKDDDPQTPGEPIFEADYDSQIQYDDNNFAIVIDDPLSADTGAAWRITNIGEGDLQEFR